jgi:hypothetical protein
MWNAELLRLLRYEAGAVTPPAEIARNRSGQLWSDQAAAALPCSCLEALSLKMRSQLSERSDLTREVLLRGAHLRIADQGFLGATHLRAN